MGLTLWTVEGTVRAHQSPDLEHSCTQAQGQALCSLNDSNLYEGKTLPSTPDFVLEVAARGVLWDTHNIHEATSSGIKVISQITLELCTVTC